MRSTLKFKPMQKHLHEIERERERGRTLHKANKDRKRNIRVKHF